MQTAFELVCAVVVDGCGWRRGVCWRLEMAVGGSYGL